MHEYLLDKVPEVEYQSQRVNAFIILIDITKLLSLETETYSSAKVTVLHLQEGSSTKEEENGGCHVWLYRRHVNRAPAKQLSLLSGQEEYCIP